MNSPIPAGETSARRQSAIGPGVSSASRIRGSDLARRVSSRASGDARNKFSPLRTRGKTGISRGPALSGFRAFISRSRSASRNTNKQG